VPRVCQAAASAPRCRLKPIPAPGRNGASATTTTRILQLSDLHPFADPEARLFGIPTRELLQDVLAHVQESGVRPDHVVVTGDHTHDERAETYAAVRELLEPFLDRLWHLPGNHDDRATLRSAFADRIPGDGADRITFAFDAGSWLCLGLDTHVPGEVGGRIGADQIEWIRGRLDEHQPRAAVLFMHHPPVELGMTWLDRIGLEDAHLLRDLLAEEPRIRLVCCGHVHHESSRHVGAAEVVTVPSTGLQFSAVSDTAEFVTAPPGYRIIELAEDGYSTWVVRLPEARYTPTQP
jgi:3',5'-cyclic-AMP phosphodiesterase